MYPLHSFYRKDPQANPLDNCLDKKKGLLNSKHRVDSFSEHVLTYLASLKENSIGNHSLSGDDKLKKRLEGIFTKATEDFEKLTPSQPVVFPSKKEAKEYSKHFRAFEKKAISIIRDAQLQAVIEITKSKTRGIAEEDIAKDLKALAQGGLASTIVKLKLYLFQNQKIIDNFKAAKQILGNTQELQPDSIKRRCGVQQKIIRAPQESTLSKIETSASPQLYSIKISFSKNHIKKQLKSLAAQELSNRKRDPIKKEIRIKGKKFTSHQLPLNMHFDEHYKINQTEKISTFFTKTHGNKGVSSTNRQEPKLVNGWESSLEIDETLIYKSLRHAITSDKYETNQSVREQNSYLAARELVLAAITQHIYDMGLTQEQLKQQGGIQLTLNSVSLVTPDDIRPIKDAKANEKHMLEDQVNALRGLQNIRNIEWQGVTIPLNLKINTFNFGVNAGAVDFRQGSSNQHKFNKPAMAALEEQVNTLLSSSIEEKEKQHIERLFTDIKQLTAKSTSYLNGDNPYEVGAKILNLSYVMDRASMKTDAKLGFKAAFNCMSGKDRTGIMDNIAKAYAVMANLNGEYPTHEELKKDEQKRTQFQNILIPLLFEGGSLEITELNTGARGYKITKHALVGGLSEDYLLDLIGLSGTTAS